MLEAQEHSASCQHCRRQRYDISMLENLNVQSRNNLKSLLVTFIGCESELESYGYQVSIGTAASRKPKAKNPPTV